MQKSQHYHLASGAVSLLTIYLLTSEVFGRWADAIDVYQALREKNRALLDPAAVAERGKELRKEEALLLAAPQSQEARFDDSQSGVVQRISSLARESHVELLHLMPKQVDKRADHVEIPLSLELEGDFNRIGKFVNHLEMSPLPIAIKSLDMRPSSRQLKLLDVKLDLTASLPAARKMP